MHTTEEPLELLTPVKEDDAALARYGRFLGFPFSAVLRPGEVILGISFEIRFLPRSAEGDELGIERRMGADFDKLAEDGEINVSINTDSASLTVYEIHDGPDDETAWALFEKFAHRLAELGFSAGETCHYCRERQGGNLVFQAGRVGQICQPCLEARAQRLLKQQTLSRHSVSHAVKSVLVGTLAVAVAWFLFWRIFDGTLVWMGGVSLPMKLWLIGAVFLGAGFSFIAVWCGRKVVIENHRIIAALAATSVVLGIAAGELCSAAWLVFKVAHVINFHAAAIVYPKLLKATDGTYVTIKVLTFLSALASSFLIRPSRKATLGL